MGAKTWMLVYADSDPSQLFRSATCLDEAKSLALAKSLFPGVQLQVSGQGDLSYTCPDDDQVLVGCFQGVAVIAASELAIDHPSRLPRRFLEDPPHGNIYLHAMHSAVDWLAFARWQGGSLVRAVSVSPESGVIEDLGPRLGFEEPYWAGRHPVLDPSEDPGSHPLPFHPLELGEAALAAFFGYQLEGRVDASPLDPGSVPLLRLQRSKSWWKFWK